MHLIKRKAFNQKHSNKTKKNAIAAIGLSLLLGLGWGLGLTATSTSAKELTFIFQVLFSLLVGSQGVLIFVFYGVRSPDARSVWQPLFAWCKLRKEYTKNLFVESNTIIRKVTVTTNKSWQSELMTEKGLQEERKASIEMATLKNTEMCTISTFTGGPEEHHNSMAN